MKKILSVMLALAVALTVVACGKKSDDAAKDRIGTAETGMEFYVATSEDGSKTVVDKSGAAAEGKTLDASGNIVDKDGQIIVAADKVQQLPTGETKPNENSEPNSSGDSSSGPSASGSTGSEAKNSTDSAGSGSSDSKAPSGTGGSGSSGNSGSSSSGGSNSGSTPTAPDPKPAHQHSWEPVYKTKVVDDYEMDEFEICNSCGADITGKSLKEHYKSDGCSASGWHSDWREVKVGSHEEQILDHYICSCGEIKSA